MDTSSGRGSWHFIQSSVVFLRSSSSHIYNSKHSACIGCWCLLQTTGTSSETRVEHKGHHQSFSGKRKRRKQHTMALTSEFGSNTFLGKVTQCTLSVPCEIFPLCIRVVPPNHAFVFYGVRFAGVGVDGQLPTPPRECLSRGCQSTTSLPVLCITTKINSVSPFGIFMPHVDCYNHFLLLSQRQL